MVFFIITYMVFLASKNTAIISIKEMVGTNSKYFPNGFKKSSRWMRRLYKFKNTYIPWFSYYGLLFSTFSWFFLPIEVIVFHVSKGDMFIHEVLVQIHVYFALIDCGICLFGNYLYKKTNIKGK